MRSAKATYLSTRTGDQVSKNKIKKKRREREVRKRLNERRNESQLEKSQRERQNNPPTYKDSFGLSCPKPILPLGRHIQEDGTGYVSNRFGMVTVSRATDEEYTTAGGKLAVLEPNLPSVVISEYPPTTATDSPSVPDKNGSITR